MKKNGLMTEARPKRVLNSDQEDRLSNLPEGLIDLILERVPIQDAARMSGLSTKWRHIWNTLTVLVFDDRFFESMRKKFRDLDGSRSISIVNQVLFHHTGPISIFNLCLPNTLHVGSYNQCFDGYKLINQWMSFLSRGGIRELIIGNKTKQFVLPPYVFSCTKLTMLAVENCAVRTPAKFGGFCNLKKLYLKAVAFGLNCLGTFGDFPHLRELAIWMCSGVCNFDINATKLSILSMVDCDDVMLSLFMKNENLSTVDISTCQRIAHSNQEIDLEKLFFSLRKAEVLFMDGYLLEFLFAGNIPNKLPVALTHLRDLRLIKLSLSGLDQLLSVLCLLRSSPNLRLLSISQEDVIMEANDEITATVLKASNCLEEPLNQVRNVFLETTVGTRTDLLFMKLILARSPCLKNLTIQLRKVPCDIFVSALVNTVMQSPRASPRVEITYLHPKP